jgi:hypothetical protein
MGMLLFQEEKQVYTIPDIVKNTGDGRAEFTQ